MKMKPRPPAGMPKKPKAPQAKQLSNMAKSQAKQRLKRIITVLLIVAVAAIIAGIVYFVKFHGKQPKDALKKAITAAYSNRYEAFRDAFTEDSQELLENSWNEAGDPWEHMMDGITPIDRPKILNQEVKGDKTIPTAEVLLLLEDEERTIHMRKEEGVWKINLNVAINPRKLTLPPDVDPEILEQFNYDDDDVWWEEDEESASSSGGSSKGSGNSKTKGFLRKMGLGRFVK